MRKTTARILWAVCIIGATTGCYVKAKTVQTERETDRGIKMQAAFAAESRPVTSVEIFPGPEKKEEVSAASENVEETPVLPAMASPRRDEKAGEEETRREEPAEKEPKEESFPKKEQPDVKAEPQDAVYRSPVCGFARVGETVYEKPAAKEEDQQQSGQTDLEEPELSAKYVNRAGDLRYEYRDGVWYEYKYASGDIVLDEQNEELALRLLNMDGSYDGYTIMSTERTLIDAEEKIQYGYHVRYQRILKLDGRPEELDRLLALKATKTGDTIVIEDEEPVWVLSKKIDGTNSALESEPEKEPDGDKPEKESVWEQMKLFGVEYAVLRCSYGDGKEGGEREEQIKENIEAARAAGIETGILLVSQAGTKREAMEEADFVLRLAEKYRLTGPVMIGVSGKDPEDSEGKDRPDTAMQTACVKAFCRVVRLSGFEPVICADADWAAEHLKVEDWNEYRFWISQYHKNITCAIPYEIWSYTEQNFMDDTGRYIGFYVSYGE